MGLSTADNRAKHWAKRQQTQAARGRLGIAEAWWDRARQIARQKADAGDETALDDLARTLENFVSRYTR